MNVGIVAAVAGALSACTKASAVAKRSAGSLASALWTAASTLAGTERRRDAQPLGLLGHHGGDHRLNRGSGVRRLARQHLVEQAAEAVDIGPGVEAAFAGGLLRAHVARGAEGEAGLRHPVAAGVAHGQRDAEVGDQRRPVVQQDVLRLDVAVDHAVAVGVVQRRADLLRRAGRRPRPAAGARGSAGRGDSPPR